MESSLNAAEIIGIAQYLFNMATEKNVITVDRSSKDLKIEDLDEFSNIFASEFNNSDIHDRVLCFQIIEDDEFCLVTTESKNGGKGSFIALRDSNVCRL